MSRQGSLILDEKTIDATSSSPETAFEKAFPAETCEWCGLRPATDQLYLWPTCTECIRGGRRFRIEAYQQRLKRAVGE